MATCSRHERQNSEEHNHRLGRLENGPLRETGFDISVASEVMAVLALATSLEDLRKRIGKIVVALDKSGKAVTTRYWGSRSNDDSLEGCIKTQCSPNARRAACLCPYRTFANIAHGNSSITADLIASEIADFVVTESGFGSDMGFEN